ncbi:hypothetical protein TNCV_4141521 [Trichonephila clavipes]|nr:hypothetical protein TNCV_4141521 [Trichonephila clavipes]
MGRQVHPDAVGIRCLIFVRHTTFLVGLRGGWRHARRKCTARLWLVSPHSSLNTSHDVIPEPDLLYTSEAERLDGFPDLGVIHIRRIPKRECQRIRHPHTACHGQLTCSRCAFVGHASSDCNLEQQCVNCL